MKLKKKTFSTSRKTGVPKRKAGDKKKPARGILVEEGGGRRKFGDGCQEKSRWKRGAADPDKQRQTKKAQGPEPSPGPGPPFSPENLSFQTALLTLEMVMTPTMVSRQFCQVLAKSTRFGFRDMVAG